MTIAIELERPAVRTGDHQATPPEEGLDSSLAPQGVASPTDPRWTAVLARDASWDGAFVFAVTSTRIYCRPSCPSRRPREDRVRFFEKSIDARHAGFRACKRCLPDSPRVANDRQLLVSRTVEALHRNENASLDELSAIVGASRSHLQRTFTEVIGTSPLEYATARKAERMRRELVRGQKVTHAAYAAGFESMPRAYAASSRHLGMAPGVYKAGAEGVSVRYRIVECALGTALVALTDQGVCRVILGNDAAKLERELRSEYPKALLSEVDEMMARSIDAVVDAAAGRAVVASVPLDLHGTAFQQHVWRTLMRIPAGETLSYTIVAREVGSPNAVRAVGSACGANPVALLVPCHRVVRNDGGLGGYRWGLQRKQRLLDAERAETREESREQR
jgi:AraC family transcriptional regulator, regulatory protein of adaptative response / methylated-DNA-[protein]-cysteine methyltransferase